MFLSEEIPPVFRDHKGELKLHINPPKTPFQAPLVSPKLWFRQVFAFLTFQQSQADS